MGLVIMTWPFAPNRPRSKVNQELVRTATKGGQGAELLTQEGNVKPTEACQLLLTKFTLVNSLNWAKQDRISDPDQ